MPTILKGEDYESAYDYESVIVHVHAYDVCDICEFVHAPDPSTVWEFPSLIETFAVSLPFLAAAIISSFRQTDVIFLCSFALLTSEHAAYPIC